MPHGPHSYAVTVTEGENTTNHVVDVPAEMQGDDEERLVRESFLFLLEREPATSILPAFPLDTISRYFPDYLAEIRARLTS